MTKRRKIFIFPHPGPDGVHLKVFKNHFAVFMFDKKLKPSLIIKTNGPFLSSVSKQRQWRGRASAKSSMFIQFPFTGC